MDSGFQVLVVAGASDAKMVTALLRGRWQVKSRHISSAEALREALKESQWDALICDYGFQPLPGLQALRIRNDSARDCPFVMICGEIGEEAAVEAIRSGADALLLNQNLSRLAAVLETAMAEAAARRERRREEQDLRDKLDFIQVLIDTLPTPIFYNDPNGLYLGCNKAFADKVGLNKGEIVNKSVHDILPPDLAALYTCGESTPEKPSGPRTFEGSIVCAGGESRDVIFYSAAFSKSNSSVGGVVGALLDISERKRSESRLRYLSSHDMLTGIYNRAYFDEELDRLKKGRKFPVSIVMADVDRLKETNDELGHAAGDELLKKAAELFKGAFRREDVAARIGGDEFAAILPNTDAAALIEAMERLQQHIAASNVENPGQTVSLSIGAATAKSGDELMAAWRKADQRMYRHKKRRSATKSRNREQHPSLWDSTPPLVN
jgi:diguanylate cyclase (GGDEF)-like protein/PAS domain S-box-containing protein